MNKRSESKCLERSFNHLHSLHALIDDWTAKNQLRVIERADSDLKIGALSEVIGAQPEAPALLFDNIPGYPKRFGF